jgi:hypothetical protein
MRPFSHQYLHQIVVRLPKPLVMRLRVEHVRSSLPMQEIIARALDDTLPIIQVTTNHENKPASGVRTSALREATSA